MSCQSRAAVKGRETTTNPASKLTQVPADERTTRPSGHDNFGGHGVLSASNGQRFLASEQMEERLLCVRSGEETVNARDRGPSPQRQVHVRDVAEADHRLGIATSGFEVDAVSDSCCTGRRLGSR